MTQAGFTTPPRFLPPLGLLTSAVLWGLIWYPFRLLEQTGLSGTLATLATYSIALLLILPICGRQVLPRREQLGWLVAVALVSGGTNLAYVLAVIHGEVMRVMLLFYLAPLWTVLFARLILGERANPFGWLVIALSLAGAAVMLYDSESGLPLPDGTAEWLGLFAGIGFALANVLTRRLREVPVGTRSLWVFAGVVAICILPALGSGETAVLASLTPGGWGLLFAVGAAVLAATLTVQYGLAHIPANRAIVILLFELVVAALSSWWLAGESMGLREWLGGAMIVAATLLSGKMESPDA